MLNLNTETLTAVVNSAKLAVAGNSRWLNAIDKAADELVNNPFVEWQGDHLLIGSVNGNVYASNGTCQCKAFEFGRPCYHRAAARLYQRYQEAQDRQVKIAAQAKAQAELDECFA